MAIQTIPELFLAAVRDKPRPDCFSYRDESGDYVDVSSEEALRRVRAIRQGLRSLGIRDGDRVALLAENRIEWALSDLAILCQGGVTVPIYPTLLPSAVEFIVQDCQPVAIFVSTAEQAEKIHAVRERLPFLRDVVTFEKTDLPGVMTIDQLERIGGNIVADHPPQPRDECTQRDPDDLASIIYTSGTTGDPKGVMLTHRNFVSNVLGALELFAFTPQDRCLSFLPLSHVFERTAGYYAMLHCGVGIAYAERMDTVPQDLLDVRPTIVVSVPRLYEKIYARVLGLARSGSPFKRNVFFWARRVGLQHVRRKLAGQPIPHTLAMRQRIADRLVFSKLRARTGGNVRMFVSGGAPLPRAIGEFFYAAGLVILEGYGLTETAPVLSCNTYENIRFGSVGKAFPHTELRIAEDGEILARGPQIMRGYYNNEAATNEVLSDDGWFATGDIGSFDDDGFLRITDRKKDLIVTAGGKNIAPQPVEEEFKRSKYISQAVLIGNSRPYLSVLLVPNFDTVLEFARKRGLDLDDPRELLSHPRILELFEREIAKINADLPSFNQIRKFALLADELTLEAGELTPTLKVKRFEIDRLYRNVIDGLYPTAPQDEN